MKWIIAMALLIGVGAVFIINKNEGNDSLTYSNKRDIEFEFESENDLQDFVVQVECSLYELPQIILLKQYPGRFCVFSKSGWVISYGNGDISLYDGDDLIWQVKDQGVTHVFTFDEHRKYIVYANYERASRNGKEGWSYYINGRDLKGELKFRHSLIDFMDEFEKKFSPDRFNSSFDNLEPPMQEGKDYMLSFVNQVLPLYSNQKIIKKLPEARAGDYIVNFGLSGFFAVYDPDENKMKSTYDVFKMEGSHGLRNRERNRASDSMRFLTHTIVPTLDGNFQIFINKLTARNHDLPKNYSSAVVEFSSDDEGVYRWIFPEKKEDERWYAAVNGSVHPINDNYLLVSENSVGGRLSLLDIRHGVVWEKMFKGQNDQQENYMHIYRAYIWEKSDLKNIIPANL